MSNELSPANSLNPFQNMVVWLFSAVSSVLGLIVIGGLIIGPHPMHIMIWPLSLFNFLIGLATILCGILTFNRASKTTILVAVLSGLAAIVISSLYMFWFST